MEDFGPLKDKKIPLQPGRMKERVKAKRNQKKDQQSWREAEGEGWLLHSEKLHHGGEITCNKKRLWGLKENAADGLWKAGKSKNCTHDLCSSIAHSSLSRESPVVKGGRVLESGAWSSDPGRGQMLAVKRQSEGTGVRSSTTGNVCGKSPGHRRTRCYC